MMNEEPTSSNQTQPPINSLPEMDIKIDRPGRIIWGLAFWLVMILLGAFLAMLMLRFTGSRLLAYGLAVGMLGYMVLMASIAGRNLTRPPGSGRLD